MGMILIKGLLSAARSVCCTLGLLGIVIYMASLVVCQSAQTSSLGDTMFPSMLATMLFLFSYGVMPDVADAIYEMGDADPFVAVFFIVFMLIASLCMLNMLVGILCEVVSAVSCVETEGLTVQYVNQRLMDTLLQNDLITEGENVAEASITREDYETLLLNHKTAKMLADVGVDPVGLVDFTDFLFKKGDMIPVSELTSLLLSLRGSNHACVKDIVDSRKFVISEFNERLEEAVLEIHEHLDELCEEREFGREDAIGPA